jgi:hypothetical protein
MQARTPSPTARPGSGFSGAKEKLCGGPRVSAFAFGQGVTSFTRDNVWPAQPKLAQRAKDGAAWGHHLLIYTYLYLQHYHRKYFCIYNFIPTYIPTNKDVPVSDLTKHAKKQKITLTSD